MNILIFGRGVISSQYAYILEEAGHNITFYTRKGKRDILELDILDTRKNPVGRRIQKEWKINPTNEIPREHNYDLIMVSVQHYQIKEALSYLKDKIGHATLLIYNNIWEEPLELIKEFNMGQVVWGFPGAGGGFNEQDVLTGAIFKRFTIGTFGTEPNSRNLEVQKLLKEAGFKIDFQKDFRSWLYTHFAVNASMHLESAKKESAKAAFTSYDTFRAIRDNGRELLPLLEARGINLKSNLRELKMLKMPAWTYYITLYVLPKIYAPLRKVLHGHYNPVELRAYISDVLNEAKRLNIKLPSFEKNEF